MIGVRYCFLLPIMIIPLKSVRLNMDSSEIKENEKDPELLIFPLRISDFEGK